jgi:ribose transport system permease protein
VSIVTDKVSEPQIARAGRFDRARVARRHGWTLGVYALMLVLLAVNVMVAPTFTSFDLGSIVIGTLPLAFAACGQALIVISGGIDLSLGALMALFNVISAALMERAGFSTALVIAFALMGLGFLVGAVNGGLITASGIPDIVVTLAMSFVWAGVALVVMGQPGGGAPDDFEALVTGTFGSLWVPAGAVVLVVVLAAAWLPVRKRRLAHGIYAVGSSRDAAYLSGVDVNRARILAYAYGGFFAALGGLALTAATGIGSPFSGEFYTLNSVAAVVLGGVSLAGGRGGLLGPVAASFILTLVVSILLFQGVDPNYGQVIQGGLIVAVVMVGGLVLLRRRA